VTADMIRYEDVSGMDTMQLGKVLAASGYFQDARDAAQAIVKVLAGRELGIGPVASMTGIYIVKGRVTLSANLMAAQIKRSGKYDYHVTQMDDRGCVIDFFQSGQTIGTSSFLEADAKLAGLAGGDNWKKFPRNMYFSRAIANGAKWFCPDVFSGPVYTPDELAGGASFDAHTGEVLDQPASASPATAKQRGYIAGLIDRLGWSSAQLAAHASEQGIDLASMTTTEARPFIDGLKALAEERSPKAKAITQAEQTQTNGERPLVKRLRELVAECRAAGVAVPKLPKPKDMTDEQLDAAIVELEIAYRNVQQRIETATDVHGDDPLFSGHSRGGAGHPPRSPYPAADTPLSPAAGQHNAIERVR
jgi:hypothetical protein